MMAIKLNSMTNLYTVRHNPEKGIIFHPTRISSGTNALRMNDFCTWVNILGNSNLSLTTKDDFSFIDLST